MNNYLIKKINDKLSVNNANYFDNIYIIIRLNSPAKLKYDKIEIVSWLNKIKNKYVSYDEIIKKTSINLMDKNIKFVPKSIALLVNLIKLYLPFNKISSLSNLSQLENLKVLNMIQNKITNVELSSISNFKKLESINLCHNKIVDITGLTKLKKLKELNLYNNKIVDISCLSSLTNLKELTIDYRKNTNLSCLYSINLTNLYLFGNNIPDDLDIEKILVNTKIFKSRKI